MWSTLIKKSFAVIRSKERTKARAHRRPSLAQRGQVMLEYILILAVVISIFIFFARPFLNKLNKKFENAGKSGFFAEDTSGSNFYYYPIR